MVRYGAQLALLGVILGGLACNRARVIEVRGDGGGIVAIPENTNSWPSRNRRRAEELMKKQCPNGYVIEREAETVTGVVTTTNTTTDRRGHALLAAAHIAPVTEDSQSTTSQKDVKEWRIWFRPKGSPPTLFTEAPQSAVDRVGRAPN